jgi:hypothetical protein
MTSVADGPSHMLVTGSQHACNNQPIGKKPGQTKGGESRPGMTSAPQSVFDGLDGLFHHLLDVLGKWRVE